MDHKKQIEEEGEVGQGVQEEVEDLEEAEAEVVVVQEEEDGEEIRGRGHVEVLNELKLQDKENKICHFLCICPKVSFVNYYSLKFTR